MKYKKFKSISLILPTYEEKDNIKELIDLSIEQFKKHKIDYEIIVVDDNSPDGTAKAVPKYSKVKLIKRKGKGLATAIRRGIEEAKKGYVMVMDTDLSHHPKYFPQIFKHYKKYDMVKPSRFVSGGRIKSSLIRVLASIIINIVIKIGLNIRLTDFTGSFFIMERTKLNQLQKDFIFYGVGDYVMRLIYSVKKNNFSIKEVSYTYQKRKGGKTKIRFMKSIFNYIFEILKIRFSRLIHIKIRILGNTELETKGLVLLCRKCKKPFKSYTHYGDWCYIYDYLCEDCKK